MTSTLAEYFVGVQHRLPEEAERVMKALDAHGPMNKEELSFTAKVKRAVLIMSSCSYMPSGWLTLQQKGRAKCAA